MTERVTDEQLAEWKALTERLALMDKQNATASLVWRSPRERVYGEAADAIERSVAEIERLRAALRTASSELELAAQKTINIHVLLSRGLFAAADRARAALQEEPS